MRISYEGHRCHITVTSTSSCSSFLGLQMCRLWLFVNIFCIKRSLGGFSSGGVPPGIFEYGQVNGWMKPAEAADLCETDLQCGGFTFHGTLIHQMVYEVYFFHFVSSIRLLEDDFKSLDWTSYIVNRYLHYHLSIINSLWDYCTGIILYCLVCSSKLRRKCKTIRDLI